MKFGVAYTVGSEPGRPMRQGFAAAVDEIKLADELGFDNMMISSQHFEENDILPSPFVACSFIAAQTKRIRLGPGILLFPLAYNPIHVAEDGAVFDVLSDGRLNFAMGRGFRKEEFAGFGVSRKERGPRVREGTTIIRKLWSEDHVSHDGQFWKLKDVSLRPKPSQKPNPPIWISGESMPYRGRASRPRASISASAAAVSGRPNDSMPACRNSPGWFSRCRNTGPR